MIGRPKVPARRAVETGMRRVSWVRVVVTDDGAECEVVGVGHRLPNVRRVSVDTALALAATGVPAIVRTGTDPTWRRLAG